MLTVRRIILSTLVLIVTLNKYTVCVRDRVVGGEASPIHYKYQISLQVNRNLQWLHNCGGSILSRLYVITAAHCVKGGRPEQLSVVAGTSDLSKPGSRHLIASFVIHPKYRELVTSDIAIMKVTSPFIYSPMIGPIKFSDRHVGGNQRTLLTGWGYTFPVRIGAPPKMLQRAEFMTLSNKQCLIRGLRPTSTEICAYKRLLVGACGGDSGGPLVNNGELIGLVSYGTSICGAGLPDVYTRVSVFYDWIRVNTDFTTPASDADIDTEDDVDEEEEEKEEKKEEDSEKVDDEYRDEPEVIERHHAIFDNPFGDKISSRYLLPGSRTPVFSKSFPHYYSKKSMPIFYGDVDLPITFYELDEFR